MISKNSCLPLSKTSSEGTCRTNTKFAFHHATANAGALLPFLQPDRTSSLLTTPGWRWFLKHNISQGQVQYFMQVALLFSQPHWEEKECINFVSQVSLIIRGTTVTLMRCIPIKWQNSMIRQTAKNCPDKWHFTVYGWSSQKNTQCLCSAPQGWKLILIKHCFQEDEEKRHLWHSLEDRFLLSVFFFNFTGVHLKPH